MSNSSKIRIADAVLGEEIDGKMVLLHSDTEQYFSLNDVGTRIWQLLREQKTPEQIVDILQQEYEVEASLLQADVAKLIADLTTAGLVSDQSV